MEISIYQISPGRDHTGFRFMPLYQVEKIQGGKIIDSSIYNRVFEGKVDCEDLEDVYRLFNENIPSGYRGHYMSVSDVVEIKKEGSHFFFCDSIGFSEVTFDPERARVLPSNEDMITVIEVNVNKYAKEKKIENNIKSFQHMVGGSIEEYMPFEDEIAIICNENGKVSGLPLNRAIYATDTDKNEFLKDIICGNFFICYAPRDSQKFHSLPKDLSEKYLDMFKYPERFTMENGEFTPKKFKPKEHEID